MMAGVAQLAERQVVVLDVAGSIPVTRPRDSAVSEKFACSFKVPFYHNSTVC
jgi:hypothetical protein